MVAHGHGHERDAILVVTNITLYSCGISGGLSKLRFTELPHLVHLDLAMNSLSGPIPSDIGRLAELSYLDLSGNVLNGSIPPSIVFSSIFRSRVALSQGGSGGDKPGRPLPPPSSSASPPPKLSRPLDLCRPGRIWRGGGAAETASVAVAWMVTATTESQR
uniref:Leucine-rich repeat-containing N-terminal plant-type domain-containing protein n=1 Tax=Oryza nivara TaxID=4536 RepID=A0A0E0H9M2_ORYNI